MKKLEIGTKVSFLWGEKKVSGVIIAVRSNGYEWRYNIKHGRDDTILLNLGWSDLTVVEKPE